MMHCGVFHQTLGGSCSATFQGLRLGHGEIRNEKYKIETDTCTFQAKGSDEMMSDEGTR